ncbi:LEAF RUST 10 DISEASE-RESISTANCE LOCUS RECEPTOR-LIKE PROTEIN KINASE-like 2.1 [Malus sylvestris]|uniref:LEAF RUST 10 DISEASE-RESISTANCE LOCUS RECEPTOR-LIKE PROTEIN KINASE-like 2.1 n=1 Tax=Malus sylvestris TaxID=3752 RepID=UPI0021ABEA4D|nr:LEAF RUST 10 DISEASE-RESISTANCE LOCUS RECEPTOR-LIKE PROTEIN KINASE-like 2.1 [Malus sylvestris]
MAPVALFILSVLAHLVVLHSAEAKHCSVQFCSSAGNISFPFKSTGDPPECGLFTVDCSDPERPRIQLKGGGYWHEFQGSLASTSIFIKDRDLAGRLEKDHCNDGAFDELSLPSASPIPGVSLSTLNLTLIKCNILDKNSSTQPKDGCGNAYHTYYINSSNNNLPNPLPPRCETMQVPMRPSQPNMSSSLTAEFYLHVSAPECFQCTESKGECLVLEGKFKCAKGDKQLNLKLGLVGAASVIIVLVVVCCFFWKKRIQKHQIVEAFLRSYGPLQVQRHSYSEVKKMTNSFKEKLGQGGYGAVYKGKLKDGRLVAVKVLTQLKGDGEEFMNEVAAISRTSHVNIVSLLGYCFEGSKRALIYEFMPNGSLEKFIFDASTPKNDHHHLGWETLDQISLGIAQGLEYLHRGCNTRILHFDIKPHNILLSEKFIPKISDFGLAKICSMNESIVSMLGARGTPGYIAPEVFSRNFGKVSHKSDVYSYGMMLSKMVGGKKNIDTEAENTSEIYFPHWIYQRLERDEELGMQSVTNEEDKVRARKMIIVSLWCIQTDPSNRPSMKEVIDMLEGSVDSLHIPPKPYLSSLPKSPADSSSPPKSPADSSTTLVSMQ